MADPYKYDAQGNLLVWTGTGYQLIPKIAQEDLSYYDGKPQSTLPSYVVPQGDYGTMEWGGATVPSFNFTGDAAAKYGNLANMNVTDNNFRIQDATPEGFNLLLKSGDKEGTRIAYALKDGQWVPTVQGTQGFDTNAEGTADFKGLGTVLGAALTGGALFGADGTSGLLGGLGGATAPGAMNVYGVLDTSLALPGTTFVDALAGLPYAPPAGELYGPPSDLASDFMGPPSGLSGPGTPPVSPGELYGPPSDLDPAFNGPPADAAGPGTLPPSTTPPTVSTPSNIPEWLKGLSPDLLKLIGVGVGGLIGSKTGDNPGSSTPTPAVPVPKMYGGDGTSGATPNWGLLGPTETERRMRKQYLPSLLGGANPWGY